MPKGIRTQSHTSVDDTQDAHTVEAINGVEETSRTGYRAEDWYRDRVKVSLALAKSLDRVTELLALLRKFETDYKPLGIPKSGEVAFVVPPGPVPSIDPNSEVVTRALRLIEVP